MAVTFTINSVDYPELNSFTSARDHGGYMFHDFGASVVSSQPSWSWGTDSNHFYNSTTFLRSSGAVTLGATVGYKKTSNSNVNVIPLNNAVSSGRHIFVVNSVILDGGPTTDARSTSDISITDTVGGNVDQHDYDDIGFAYIGAYTPSGVVGFHIWVNFYKIVNSLSSTDAITVTLPNDSPLNFETRLHVVNGLDLSNPVGPNSGGNLVGFGDGYFSGPYTSKTRTVSPTPNWVGPTFNTAVYQLASKPGVHLPLDFRSFQE